MRRVGFWNFVAFVLLACSAEADGPSVLAAAKVKDAEKTVNGRVYSLVVVRIAHVSAVWQQMSTGVGFQFVKPTVQFDLCGKGKLPTLSLNKEEQKVYGRGLIFTYTSLHWARLPKKGVLNVRYGLAYRGKFAEKGLPQPLSVPVRELPVIEAKAPRDITEAIEKLVPKKAKTGQSQ